MKPLLRALSLALFLVGFAAPLTADHHAKDERVFELRIYYAHDGKLESLLTRFRDHTCAIFERLGAENIGYWVETEPAEGEEPKLYYVIAHPSRQAADDFWKTFMQDEAWKTAFNNSIKNGRLVKKVDRLFMAPTDFSAIR
jgi:hypothetical protein